MIRFLTEENGATGQNEPTLFANGTTSEEENLIFLDDN